MASTSGDRFVPEILRLIRGTDSAQHEGSDLHLYHEELANFLPDDMVDAHVHLWTPECLAEPITDDRYRTTMLELIDGFSAAAMARVYAELFPGKRVRGVVFGLAAFEADAHHVDAFVAGEADHVAARLLIPPWDREAGEPRRLPTRAELERRLDEGPFVGFKPYPEHARHRQLDDVAIDDFVTDDQWRLADERGLVIMLHLPRQRGIADPENVATLATRLDRFQQARVVLAHLGVPAHRADLSVGLNLLARYPNLLFDTSMVTDAELVATAIAAVGPGRVLFGTDLPFSLVRGHKEVRDAQSRLVTQERYGFGIAAGRRCTYLLYASLLAIKGAATELGLTRDEVRAVVADNARRVFTPQVG